MRETVIKRSKLFTDCFTAVEYKLLPPHYCLFYCVAHIGFWGFLPRVFQKTVADSKRGFKGFGFPLHVFTQPSISVMHLCNLQLEENGSLLLSGHKAQNIPSHQEVAARHCSAPHCTSPEWLRGVDERRKKEVTPDRPSYIS